MAMTWEGSDLSEDSTGISTLMMPLGAMTTTIQTSRPFESDAAAADTLSDADIEKAIDEIRATIQKSNKLMPK
jgi:hypothetical protein